MKKILVLVLLVAVAVVMVMTKPEKRAHKEAMMKAVTEYIDDEAEDRGFGNNILTKLGKGAARSAVSLAIDLKLKLDDYYLFNATHIRLDGKNKMLSLGLFGKVITFDKKMLREALEEGDKLEQKDLDEEEDKEALREARKAEKEAKKAAKKAEKEAKKAAKKAGKEAKKAAKKAEKEAKKAAKKAEKEAKKAAKAAAKEND